MTSCTGFIATGGTTGFALSAAGAIVIGATATSARTVAVDGVMAAGTGSLWSRADDLCAVVEDVGGVTGDGVAAPAKVSLFGADTARGIVGAAVSAAGERASAWPVGCVADEPFVDVSAPPECDTVTPGATSVEVEESVPVASPLVDAVGVVATGLEPDAVDVSVGAPGEAAVSPLLGL